MSLMEVTGKRKANNRNISEKIFAPAVFIAQFIYYQFQPVMYEWFVSILPFDQIRFALLNDPETLVNLLHVLVHMAFTLLIIQVLYRDVSGTRLVFYLILLLTILYAGLNIAGKISNLFALDIISVQIYSLISSPFITIFSIPMLLLKYRK
jgi:hypothetical protein